MFTTRFETDPLSLDQIAARRIVRHLDSYESLAVPPVLEVNRQLFRNVIGIEPEQRGELRQAAGKVFEGDGTINQLREEFCCHEGIDGNTLLHWPESWHPNSKVA